MHAIEKENSKNSDRLTLIKQIWRLIEDRDIVKVEHAFRKYNKCVDVLANVSCILDSELIIFYST